MKALLVEDDPQIASAVRDALEAEGFAVHVVRDGNRAVHVATSSAFSVILLDVMLPGLDGHEICRQIRAAKINVPLLMLTARDAVQDRVKGLDAGADDYLAKPFDLDELLARVRALLRRERAVRGAELVLGDLIIDTNKKSVLREGQPVELTSREYSLLEALVTRPGHILSKEKIIHRIWFDEELSTNAVEVHVKNLRRKIDVNRDSSLIQTVYGMGYRIES